MPFASFAAEGAAFSQQVWVYAGFIGLVVVLLALDLMVFHRHAHAVRMKEAIGWSIFWIGLALLFTGAIYLIYETQWMGFGVNVRQLGEPARAVGGWEAARLYLTGYVIEKSLSLDNLFVIALIFGYFAIPAQYQHRVLFWGILTAVVLRGIMIALGAALIHRFEWVIYIFGAFLVYTAIRMALSKQEQIDPEHNPAVRLIRKLFPVTTSFDGQKFFTRHGAGHVGVLSATPLTLALVMVETADVVFAVDSIPAIFGITLDPFIVFTSNIFAILGLRSLYFCLAALLDRFRYLKWSLVVILGFVGIKMLLIDTPLKIDPTWSLLTVLGLLTLGVVASWLHPLPPPETEPHSEPPTPQDPTD